VGAAAKPDAAWPLAGAGLAVLAGLAIRATVSSPLWLDEALSVNIAQLPLSDIGGALRQDGHPPLYYWLLHGWTEVVGDGDRAVRALSVVLGLLALPLGWALGRRIGGRDAAVWTIVLLSLSPYLVRYGTEARMYSLVVVLVLASAVLVLDALSAPTWPRLVGIGLTTAALLYTQYWAFYLLAGGAAVLAWRWWSEVGERRAIGRILAAMAVGGLTFVLWVPAFLDQLAHTGTPWSAPARPTRILADSLVDLGSGGLGTFPEAVLLAMVAVVALAVSVLTRPPDGGPVVLTASGDPATRHVAVVVATTLVLGAAVGLASGAAFNSRYAAVVVPFLLVLVATGLTRLPMRWPRVGLGGALVVLALVSSIHVARLDRTEAGDLADLIVAGAQPGDAVLVCPDQLGVSLERALRQAGSDIPVLPYPEIDGDPRFVRWRDYEERNDAADPGAVAAAVDEQVDGAIWFVANPTYRTFEGDCEQVAATLTQARGPATLARPIPAERAFEHADLSRYDPR
jgi:uncharacterized membrane protein